MSAMCIPRSGSVDPRPLNSIPALFGNVGIIFIKGDLKEDREEANNYKDPIKFDASVASLVAKVEENEEEDHQFAWFDDMIEKCGWIDFSSEF